MQRKQESLRGIISSSIELRREQQAKLESTEAQKLPTQDREFIGGMINNKRIDQGGRRAHGRAAR